MPTVIQRAQKGDASAFLTLAQQDMERALFLCDCLLLDRNAGETEVLRAVKSAWEAVAEGKVSSQEEFSSLVLGKVINGCKNRMLKKNSRSFQLPQNRNFNLSAVVPENQNVSGEDVFLVLNHLPPLHRFCTVLHEGAKMETQQIGKLLNVGKDAVELALKAEEENLKRIGAAFAEQGKSVKLSSVQAFHQALAQGTRSPEGKAGLEKAAQAVSAPLKKKEKKKTRVIAIAIVAVAAVIAIALGAVMMSQGTGGGQTSSALSESEMESSQVASTQEEDYTPPQIEATHYADIAIRDYGTITVALDGNTAPKTVENFVSLAESGFYDGLTFHRIIEGFMMQGGDPEGTGNGGSGTNIEGEFSENGVENNLSHVRGCISMARSGEYNSASSQFFIVHQDSPHLDGSYAAFGYVTEGIDVVDAVCESAEPTDNNGTIAPEDQPVIESVTIREA